MARGSLPVQVFINCGVRAILPKIVKIAKVATMKIAACVSWTAAATTVRLIHSPMENFERDGSTPQNGVA